MQKFYTIITKTYGNGDNVFNKMQVEIKKELFDDFNTACEEAASMFEAKLEQLHVKEDAYKELFPDNGVFKAVEYQRKDIPFERAVIVYVMTLTSGSEESDPSPDVSDI